MAGIVQVEALQAHQVVTPNAGMVLLSALMERPVMTGIQLIILDVRATV